MEIYSSRGATRFIVSTLLILQITATSSIGESASESDFQAYVNTHASTQKPMLCQIYSKATKKHIQIFKGKIAANGEDGDPYSKVEKTSHNIGIVSIRGVKTGRYLCVSKRGKFVSKKKMGRDNSCKFVENMTSNLFTYFKSEKKSSWFIGFNGKTGKAKKGRRTAMYQDACNFLIREQETNHDQIGDPSLEDFAKQLSLRIRGKTQALTRKRRHRFQTVEPTEVMRSLFNVIGSYPINGSKEDKEEWKLRARNFIRNRSASNSTLSVADLLNSDVGANVPPTPDPVKAASRHHPKTRRKGKARNSKNGRKRSKGRSKVGTKENPTVVPLREKLTVPKTPKKMHEELTAPPTVASPSFEKIRRSRKLPASATQANSISSAKSADNHSKINDASNDATKDSKLNISLNTSDNEKGNILNKDAVTHLRRSKAKSRRNRHKSRTTS